MQRAEVITVERRRRWSAGDKRGIVAESLEPGANISAVARQYGMHPSQLFNQVPFVAMQGTEQVGTCAIITGEPNPLVAPIHDLVPVILSREAWAQWLGEEPARAADMKALLKPFPAERMWAYPGSLLAE